MINRIFKQEDDDPNQERREQLKAHVDVTSDLLQELACGADRNSREYLLSHIEQSGPAIIAVLILAIHVDVSRELSLLNKGES